MRCSMFIPLLISLLKRSLEMTLKTKASLISLGLPACRHSLQPVLQLVQLTQFPKQRTVVPDKTCSCKLHSLFSSPKGRDRADSLWWKEALDLVFWAWLHASHWLPQSRADVSSGPRGAGAPGRSWKTPRALFSLFLTLALLNFATCAGTVWRQFLLGVHKCL